VFFHLRHYGLEAFLEIAAIAGACQQCAHIKAIDRGICQNLGGFTGDDLARQTLCYGRFTHTRVANQQGVVLAAAAQHLHAAFNLVIAPDQRIDLVFAGPCVQIDAVFGQR